MLGSVPDELGVTLMDWSFASGPRPGKTGLFLDQRLNRRETAACIRKGADAFCNMGSGLCARKGGAFRPGGTCRKPVSGRPGPRRISTVC